MGCDAETSSSAWLLPVPHGLRSGGKGSSWAWCNLGNDGERCLHSRRLSSAANIRRGGIVSWSGCVGFVFGAYAIGSWDSRGGAVVWPYGLAGECGPALWSLDSGLAGVWVGEGPEDPHPWARAPSRNLCEGAGVPVSELWGRRTLGGNTTRQLLCSRGLRRRGIQECSGGEGVPFLACRFLVPQLSCIRRPRGYRICHFVTLPSGFVCSRHNPLPSSPVSGDPGDVGSGGGRSSRLLAGQTVTLIERTRGRQLRGVNLYKKSPNSPSCGARLGDASSGAAGGYLSHRATKGLPPPRRDDDDSLGRGAVGTGPGLGKGHRSAKDLDKVMVVSSDEEPVDASAVRPVARQPLASNGEKGRATRRSPRTTSGSEMETEETRSAFFAGTPTSLAPLRKRPATRRQPGGSSSGGSDKASFATAVKRGRAVEEGESNSEEENVARSTRRVEVALSSVKTLPASCLAKEMERALSVIVDVALKSKNLKGGCVRALKTSAALLGEAKEILLQRTSGEENEILRARLEEERKKSSLLEKELGLLREGQARLRADMDLLATAPKPARDEKSEEELRGSLMRDLGAMMDAKLQGIADRLLPEKRLRPPLAADKRPPPAPASAAVAEPAGRVASRKKNGATREQEKTARPLPPPPPSMDKTWTEVRPPSPASGGVRRAASAGALPPASQRTPLAMARYGRALRPQQSPPPPGGA
ncbi:Gag protein [Danaus plexippus plexippus]|uniref:Gag protein n=1 Tax=Danaus plexippus plexippus TaxID=278856 RepID=A0A212FL35_DANPL|nr:Gag protein [Danaus plexippus plexippus]